MGKLKFYILSILCTLLIGCKQQNENKSSLAKDVSKTAVQENNSNTVEYSSNFSDLERKVHVKIDSIDNSKGKKLVNHLQDYLTYKNEVDGSIAELYFAFAFNFVESNSKTFFNSMDLKDTLLLKEWADLASYEINLVNSNVDDKNEYMEKLTTSFKANTDKLSSDSKTLANYYFQQLLKAVEQK